MLSDIEIAQNARMQPIGSIAGKLGIADEFIEPYGRYKAKIDHRAFMDRARKGKVVLVTAINPTPEGEGKTTVSIGLADALSRLGASVSLTLREPSLGPVFGVKGGAAGGGYAQIVPMEDINLHFTGDMHAITSANNLIAAMTDNSIQHGNPLGIDPRRVTWRRCIDMNDRQLRFLVSGLGGKMNGMPREESFDITAASEVMAAFCLAHSLQDLKDRLSRMIVGYTFSGDAVRAGDIHAAGAACALLRDAFKPNLVQTLEGTPAFVHGGPFANIAHGCNSVIATEAAARLSDIVVTEAGFGADLGAEKFIDIKCRQTGMMPSVIVLVASVRVLKSHGGARRDELSGKNAEALRKGLCNLDRHIMNIRDVWHVTPIVAVNRFADDSAEEISIIEEHCRSLDIAVSIADVWAKGGEGGLELADTIMKALGSREAASPSLTYPDRMPVADKIRAVAERIYHADGVIFARGVLSRIRKAEDDGFGSFPVCIAKTQYSFSDDPKKTGAPEGFRITIRDVRVAAGAGFIVAYAGDIVTMPGLPETPVAEHIDVSPDGTITGLS